MARMLQALKNLEARGERPPAAQGVLAHLADKPAEKASNIDANGIVLSPPGASRDEPGARADVFAALPPEAPSLVTQLISPRREPVARAPEPPAPEPVRASPKIEPAWQEAAPASQNVGTAPPPEPAPAPAITRRPRDIVDKLLDRRERPATAPAAPPSTPPESRPSRREPSELETAVRRTLASALRVAPLKQMADRLLADVRRSRSRTLLMVGVGSSSSSHEALLYSAALLAPEVGKLLLIDADANRRTLTLGLEYGHEAGLADVLAGGEGAKRQCRPTALEGVQFLPGGLWGECNLAHQGSRLGDVLHGLSADFGLVLVDGGRCDEASALVWSRLCDATYFVVKLGAIEAREAQAALRDFRAGGARVLGCIAG